MKLLLRYFFIIGTVSLLGAGCSAVPGLPSSSSGNADVTMELVIEETLTEYVMECEGELLGYEQSLILATKGNLSGAGWKSKDNSYEGTYHGWYKCYSPWGEEHNFTHTWDSPLTFNNLREAPYLHIRIYGDEALVLLGPGIATYHYPGCPDRTYCQEPEGIPSGPDNTCFSYSYFPDAERPPDADSSSLEIVNSGIVLMRLPVKEIYAGTSANNTVFLDNGCEGNVKITLSLTSR